MNQGNCRNVLALSILHSGGTCLVMSPPIYPRYIFARNCAPPQPRLYSAHCPSRTWRRTMAERPAFPFLHASYRSPAANDRVRQLRSHLAGDDPSKGKCYAYWHRKILQRRKGLRFHPARRWQQGRLRPQDCRPGRGDALALRRPADRI